MRKTAQKTKKKVRGWFGKLWKGIKKMIGKSKFRIREAVGGGGEGGGGEGGGGSGGGGSGGGGGGGSGGGGIAYHLILIINNHYCYDKYAKQFHISVK